MKPTIFFNSPDWSVEAELYAKRLGVFGCNDCSGCFYDEKGPIRSCPDISGELLCVHISSQVHKNIIFVTQENLSREDIDFGTNFQSYTHSEDRLETDDRGDIYQTNEVALNERGATEISMDEVFDADARLKKSQQECQLMARKLTLVTDRLNKLEKLLKQQSRQS